MTIGIAIHSHSHVRRLQGHRTSMKSCTGRSTGTDTGRGRKEQTYMQSYIQTEAQVTAKAQWYSHRPNNKHWYMPSNKCIQVKGLGTFESIAECRCR